MYCPQCGQQQVSDSLRFCSRCGFPLEGVLQLLGSGGVLPLYQLGGPREMSARLKGVRQGAVLFLAGAVLVPILAVVNGFTQGANILDILVPLAAILFFVGGLMRMLFAALFEEAAATHHHVGTNPYAPPPLSQLSVPAHGVLLPAPANPPAAWRPRPNTSEIRQPSSVTENTTRLLDKDEPTNR